MIKESKWTDELVKKLIDLHVSKNYSTMAIAQELGFTKNAIIGKIYRLKLSQESTVGTVEKKEDKILETQIPVTPKEKGSYKLEEIVSNMCVWPYGDDEFRFCGEPTVYSKPYCKDHLDLVYLSVKRAMKKRSADIYTEDDVDEADETDNLED
ncbi:Global cell cycle regulator GcrA-like protein [Candidatus Hepatincolaceae symbiont of Richtersius coronifer]